MPEISSLRSKDPNFKSTLSNSEQFVTIQAKLPTHLIMVYCSKLLLFLEFKDFFLALQKPFQSSVGVHSCHSILYVTDLRGFEGGFKKSYLGINVNVSFAIIMFYQLLFIFLNDVFDSFYMHLELVVDINLERWLYKRVECEDLLAACRTPLLLI